MDNDLSIESLFVMQHSPFQRARFADRYPEVIIKPLSFERINGSHKQRQRKPNTLFNLPIELLSEVVRHIPEGSLSSFALASWDCCQLARSRQFRDVTLDFSNASVGLVSKLMFEVKERLGNNGKTTRPSLGACIRRFTVAIDSRLLRYAFGIEYDEYGGFNWDDRFAEDGGVLRQAMYKAYTINTDALGVAIRYGAMPNLEALRWLDPVLLRNGAWENLVSSTSTIKDVELRGIHVPSDFSFNSTTGGWQIQHLVMHVICSANLGDEPNSDTRQNLMPFYASVLRLCAPHLQRLDWTVRLTTEGDPNIKLPKLTSLRELRLSTIHPQITPALMPARNLLRILEIGPHVASNVLDGFLSIGNMPCLATLIFTHKSDNSWASFLRKNTQISKLMFTIEPDLDAFENPIEQDLLQIIGQSFKCLKSLSIRWNAGDIPESALSLIGGVSTLEQLYLLAGGPMLYLVDHSMIIHHISLLFNLKRLAIAGDTYIITPDPVMITGILFGTPDTYYRRPLLERDVRLQDSHSDGNTEMEGGSEDDVDGNDANEVEIDSGSSEATDESSVLSGFPRRSIWNQEHQARMLELATMYSNTFPKLEWISFGRLIMDLDLDHPGYIRASTQDMSEPDRYGRTVESVYGLRLFMYRQFGWPWETAHRFMLRVDDNDDAGNEDVDPWCE